MIDYKGKVVLAPMVRAGTFPLRALCLQYGADLVYTEEIIDRRLIGSERTVNAETGAIEYSKWCEKTKKKDLIFQTFPWEKERLVFQLGTPDGPRALEAAQIIARDVAAVDINMGCPLKYSVAGGMGSALLSKPENIHEILTTLKKNLSCAVTCKIRLLEDRKKTVDLVKMIESTGVDALAVHCRYTKERPHEPCHWDLLRDVTDNVSIPVIANGDVYSQADVAEVKRVTGCDSVMVARGALKNPSMFKKDGVMLPVEDAVKDFLHWAAYCNNHYINTKWVLGQVMTEKKFTRSQTYLCMQQSKNLRDICDTYGIVDTYDKYAAQWEQRARGVIVPDEFAGGNWPNASTAGSQVEPVTEEEERSAKRQKVDDA